MGAVGPDPLVDNPFYVLGVSPEATRLELERQAQLLLGMLELGLATAATYLTPCGARARSADQVRAAVAALRDPERRLAAEAWARHAPPPGAALSSAPARSAEAGSPSVAPPAEAAAGHAAWPGARRRLGWGG